MMAKWSVYFGDNSEGARRDDDDDMIIAQDDGWALHETDTLENIVDWLVGEYNEENLPSYSDYWMRIIKMPDNEILDGEQVVL